MVGFPEWTTHPIPGVSLSAGGLLALADLSTIAQRTVITGGSTWLDSLLLAPGLHYQQAAEELAKRSGPGVILDAVEQVREGHSMTFRVNNAATAHYIQRIARPGETVTLDVGCLPAPKFRLRRSKSGLHFTIWAIDSIPDLGWLSHLLYLISPALTIAALVLVILLRDWWTLGCLLALMLSRILNIFVIKQRSNPASRPPPPSPQLTTPSTSSLNDTTTPPPGHRLRHTPLTSLLISLDAQPPNSRTSSSTNVLLRGHPDDLAAITATAWLRSKTFFEGYLEAAAKLIVFLVAAVSGNMTQAGALTMMALLLATAGLLALSNANARAFQVNGRFATPEDDGGGAGGYAGVKRHVVEGRVVEGQAGMAEKGQGGGGFSEGGTTPGEG